MTWLSGFTDWIVELVRGIWSDSIEFVQDFFISIVDQLLTLIADSIAVLPVPDFVQNYSIGMILGYFPNEVLYVVMYLRLPECMAIISAGFAFRMIRKVVTLFQW